MMLLIESGQAQVRLSGFGSVIGFDMTAMLALAEAYGMDREAAAVLLPAAEAGMVEALREAREERE